MKDSKQYKEFVSKVIEPLSLNEVRENSEKVKEILVSYFSRGQFTVYSFVHEYFHEATSRKSTDQINSQLCCIMGAVKDVLTNLISEFDNTFCIKNDSKEIYGDKRSSLCEHEECNNRCKFSGLDVYQCPYRDEWYHVIRRIAKFYENLHSVDNFLRTNKNAEEIYSIAADNISKDIDAINNEAIESFSKKYDEVQKKFEKKYDEILDSFNNRLDSVRQESLTNLISVMSIFAAAILASIIPMNFLNAVAKQTFTYDWVAETTPILIFVLILFVMFNLIYFLLSYVATITLRDQCNEKFESKRKLVKWVDVVLLILIIVLLLGTILMKL